MQRTIIEVWSDLACPWATAALVNLREARERRGRTDDVVFRLRSFPLELFNERPTPKRVLDLEISVAGTLAPSFPWRAWSRPDAEYPSTTLPALEALHAAERQSLDAAEALDGALRLAFFAESRCISMRHVILEAARSCGIDVEALTASLDEGTARRDLMRDFDEAKQGHVKGSPHVFVNGIDEPNPGVQLRWSGGSEGEGIPIVESFDPSVYEKILRAATDE